MKNMKNYLNSLKIMIINNYCTDFMFQGAMMCETRSPSILPLIILNFILASRYHKSVLKFMSTGFNYGMYS